jgi:N-methylhydantoinase B
MVSEAVPTGQAVLAEVAAGVDPVTFEVLRNGLASIVEEAGVMLERTALNAVINEGLDFACSFTTADGRVVAQGQRDLLAFIGTAPIWVKNTIDYIGIDRFKEGDLVVMNDPFLGGTHCQDVKTLMPVWWGEEIIAFVQNCAHWIDCGGPIPGSYNPMATHAVEEAFLIPPIHLIREGELDNDVLRLLLRNVREPETSYGDLMGQIQACRLAERRLHQLVARYGKELVLSVMEGVIRYSEALIRREWDALPDGTLTAVDFIDRDPTDVNGAPVRIQLDITIEGNRAIYDFSGSDPQVRGGVNGPKSVAISAAMLATKSMYPEIPMNEGVYQAIDWVIPDGLVVSATYPSPISGMASTVVSKTIDNVYRCFIQSAPAKVMCAETNLINVIFSGGDPRTEQPKAFIAYVWLDGGWGGRPAKKDNFTGHALFASTTKNIPVERYERDAPMLFERYEYLQDSEGAGRHRGGFGVVKALRLTHGDGRIAVQGDRGTTRPWGWDGGDDGTSNFVTYAKGTDREAEIGVFAANVPIAQGELIWISASGGGGWGDPKSRPPEWVLEDVVDELVSVEKARDVYGVAITVRDLDTLDIQVDEEATRKLRARS